MKRHLLVLAAVASCFAATQAGAMSQEEYMSSLEKIEASFKADRSQCDAMKDNAKDVCMKEAVGKQKVARAELTQQFKPSDSNARKVEEQKAEAKYDVAREKCDDQTGDAKAACVKQAKEEASKVKADLRAMKKDAEPVRR